jgi:multidrug resistance efflux pump
MESLPLIPTPPAQRWREFRIQILPVIIFVGILAMIVMMWKTFVQPSGVVGEVEAVKANVIRPDGVVAELHVDRLQYVANGQVIGTIITNR